MLAAPPASLWELLYASLGFHLEDDPEHAYPLREFCKGWCAPAQLVYEIVGGAVPWQMVFDPDLCPAECLPYLAQFVGVVITPEMSEAQIRSEIKEPTGWRRGQTESIRIATRRTLRPVAEEELLVIIRPRTPEPGMHYIRTLTAQTPEPTRTAAIVRAVTPAWEVVDYAAITGTAFADLTASKYTTFGEVAAHFPTFGDLAEALPGEL